LTTLQDALLPVFFTALTGLFFYIARDFGSSAAEFQKEKMGEFREIRAKMRGQKFSPALAAVVKLVYSRLIASLPRLPSESELSAGESVQQSDLIENRNLDQEITRILYEAEPWTKAEEAAKTMEDSAREVNRLDDIWYGNICAGSRLKTALYLASILAIVFIPVFCLDIDYLRYGWAVAFSGLLITILWLYRRFRVMRRSFERFEKDYYIR
jgi:hypothetical protein